MRQSRRRSGLAVFCTEDGVKWPVVVRARHWDFDIPSLLAILVRRAAALGVGGSDFAG